jgi:4-hydroxy-2-oxoheptanedioate aldolase
VKNALVEMWRRKEVAYGVWCYLNNDLAMEMSAAQGCDYVLVDLQHGVADIAQAIHMVRAAQFHGANPLVRVPYCDVEMIGKVLDGGAAGAVVPMVESAETAAKLVQACRYPPHGVRSYGPVRASILRGTMDPDVLGDVAAVAMIETVKGLDAAEAIAHTPGLSAIYIGSVDLSISLGLGPKMPSDDKRFVDAVARVKKACDAAGIAVGLHCPNGEVAGAYAKAGYRMVTVATDIELLKAGAKRELDAARAAGQGAAR